MNSAIDRMTKLEMTRRKVKVPKARLCRAADVNFSTYNRALCGENSTRPDVIARLEIALSAFKLGFGGGGIADLTAWRGCLALSAAHMGKSFKAAASSNPAAKASANAEWLELALVRHVAVHISVTCLGMRPSIVAKAAGMGKSAVTLAKQAVIDRCARDMGFARMIAALEAGLEL